MDINRQFVKDFNEELLIKHNIAASVAVVAATKGISPDHPGINQEMNTIVANVTNAYKYAFWSLERHQTTATKDVIATSELGDWQL